MYAKLIIKIFSGYMEAKKLIISILVMWAIIAAGAYFYFVNRMHEGMDSNNIDNVPTGKIVLPHRIVLTFDDLPAQRGDQQTMDSINHKLIRVLKENSIPAVGFVNESKLYWYSDPTPYKNMLKMWVDAGLELGNHGYSHLDPNNTEFKTYTEDCTSSESFGHIRHFAKL